MIVTSRTLPRFTSMEPCDMQGEVRATLLPPVILSAAKNLSLPHADSSLRSE